MHKHIKHIHPTTLQHILRVGGGLDCYKLRKANHLVNRILEHRVESLHEAIGKLDAIVSEPPLYSWQAKLLCYAVASGTVAPLFFKGSLVDGLLTGEWVRWGRDGQAQQVQAGTHLSAWMG